MLYDDKVTKNVRPTRPTKNALLFYFEPFLMEWIDSSGVEVEVFDEYIDYLINLQADEITEGVSICKRLLIDFNREDVSYFDNFYKDVYQSALNKTIAAWKIAYNIRDEGDTDEAIFRYLRY
jgi:hypothetical protein